MNIIKAAHIFYEYMVRDENDKVIETTKALNDLSLEI